MSSYIIVSCIILRVHAVPVGGQRPNGWRPTVTKLEKCQEWSLASHTRRTKTDVKDVWEIDFWASMPHGDENSGTKKGASEDAHLPLLTLLRYVGEIRYMKIVRAERRMRSLYSLVQMKHAKNIFVSNVTRFLWYATRNRRADISSLSTYST